MSHFTVLVLVPADTKNIEDAIAQRLAKYDENTQVEPYKRYIDADDIANMADHYKVDATDTAALVTHIKDWHGYEGGADDTGIYYLCTYNPDSKWDWYKVGGRWDREMQGKNVLHTSEWDGSFTPFALVTESGEWHQRARMGWWAMTSDEKDPETWKGEVGEILSGHRNHLAVLVDCHI